ncbi:MAG: SDR family NAD(P)-dependent oxidoreductase [Lentimicrobium sp.]|jgi:short-subunit dehydrogenase|nr:SDR family NAD(P)-dependent oxidoreductase [Lentimicrobium sp.]
MKFGHKNIWITGAASGMGRALAIALSGFNAQLILSDRDEAGLNETAALLSKSSPAARILMLDMGNTKAINDAVSLIISEFKTIHALYQFAGISQRSLVVETPLENDRKIIEINFFGVITLAKAILPSMIASGGGQIAVTSSIVGKFGFPYRSAYSASKHAIHGYFESLRAENSKLNIRVSILIPGRVQTNISKFALDKKGQEYGKMDAGQANGITSEKAAKQILRGLKRERKEIHIGGKELLMLQIRRFVPALYYKLATRIKPV